MDVDVRGVVTVVFAMFAAGVPAAVSTKALPASSTNGVQPVVILDRRVVARARPNAGAPAVAAVPARTPLTDSQTVLPVLRTARGPAGGQWLKVQLPRRPNGITGWIPGYVGAADTTPWRIVVFRNERRAVVYENGKTRARFSVVVGEPTTPTPLGRFFVVEKLRVRPGTPGAPWALATSAYSNVLQEFDGGPGQVALHGTTGLAGRLGTFASHGCIRFAPRAITWLARRVDDGTPILIRR
jgi:lipoprotein-anchoring transpeptidase ErfK/SrfK